MASESKLNVKVHFNWKRSDAFDKIVRAEIPRGFEALSTSDYGVHAARAHKFHLEAVNNDLRRVQGS